MMTKTLEKAFKEASKLPKSEQEELATWILEELEADRRWDRLLERSTKGLDRLADEAVSEHEKDETQALDPAKL